MACPSPNSSYRRCVSCRKVAPKESFWRIVRVYPSHQVQLDRGMGRSAYICPQSSCLQAARQKNRLGRSLKVAIPDRLYDCLWERLKPLEAESGR
ncbi:MAG: YlxR family protein [Chloroflexaceae bacterium]|nr:YlxR family protein [Chloroflexaceae bacterium]